MKELEEYKEMLKKIDSFLNKKGSLMNSRFIRFNFTYIEQILNKGFQLKEITDSLSENLDSRINYGSFWNSYNRHLKKINGKNKQVEKLKNEEVLDNIIVEKEKSVSDEIKDSEKNIELDWIKKPEFRQINNPHLIKEIISYELTEDDIRSLNLPPHPIKCLELITDLGLRRKAEKIDKIYFGK